MNMNFKKNSNSLCFKSIVGQQKNGPVGTLISIL